MRIDILLDAQEIVEHVEDMLAWQAISCTGSKIQYTQSHYWRAKPFILVGDEQWGVLTPKSLVVDENDGPPVLRIDSAESESDLAETMFATLGEEVRGMRFARVVERRADTETAMANGAAAKNLAGDPVADLQSEDGAAAFTGARYMMESIGEVSEQVRKQYVAASRLPQVARVFLHNAVIALKDGRATSGTTGFAFWNGQFFDFQRRRLRMNIDGRSVNISSEILLEGMMEMLARRSQWDVELSLGARRTGIGLETDAVGAREFANLMRKAEPRSGRRRSLVHWVDEHMRRKRKEDSEATVKVSSHMRGRAEFSCGLYHARIWPATGLLDRASNGDRYRGPSSRKGEHALNS